MVSIKERKNFVSFFVLWVFLGTLTCGCTIGRVHIGSEIKADPTERIAIGATSKSEILATFGPPDRIHKQFDGDIFVYAYLRKNSSKFAVEEPVVTNITFFVYTRVQQKKDSLVVLFGKDGIVRNYGFHKATGELTTF
jgi:hypothetical protein